MATSGLYNPDLTKAALVQPPGAIVGDTEPYMQLLSGGYLTTGDLNVGDSGDYTLIPYMAVECWVQFSTGTFAGQVLMRGPIVSTGPNVYQWYLATNANGSVTFAAAKNTGGAVSVTSPAGTMSAGGWFHIVATINDFPSNVYLYVNGVQVAGPTAFAVYVASMLTSAGNQDMRIGDAAGTATIYMSNVATYRGALSATRVQAHYQAGRQRGYNTSATGTRIMDVLDTAANTTPRSIGTSTRNIAPRYMVGQTPLDAITEAVAAEAVDAAVFVEADGTITFLGAAHRASSPYNTVQCVYGDAGGELDYVDLQLDYSETFLFNRWDVTREGTNQVAGQTQTASDAASIARYRQRPQSLAGIPVVADSDSATIAAAMLAKYKDPMVRVVSVSPDMSDPETCRVTFQRELMDRVQVKWSTRSLGARIDQVAFVQSISYQFTPGVRWLCKLGVSPR